jgi:hypothetical protein
MPTGAGVYALFEGTVLQLSPIPVAEIRLLSYGTTNLSSTRRFSISPAVSGRTIWDLDLHGPLNIHGPGSWQITPRGSRIDAVIEGWGPGGSSGGAGYSSNSPTDGTAGTATTFDGMVANPGAPSLAAVYSTNFQTISSAGGNGGTASGGDTNIAGTNGNAGTSTGGAGSYNPQGGNTSASSAPDGAPAQNGLQASTLNDPDTNSSNALIGLTRGGGATGASARVSDKNTWGASGAGGNGGYFAKTYNGSVLLDSTKTIVIGDSGNAGTASGNQNFGAANGAKGDTGWIRIS